MGKSVITRFGIVLGAALFLAGCATQQATAPYAPGTVAPYEPAPRVAVEPVEEPKVYREWEVVYVPVPSRYYYGRHGYYGPYRYSRFHPFFHGPVFGASLYGDPFFSFTLGTHRHRGKHYHKRKGHKGKGHKKGKGKKGSKS